MVINFRLAGRAPMQCMLWHAYTAEQLYVGFTIHRPWQGQTPLTWLIERKFVILRHAKGPFTSQRRNWTSFQSAAPVRTSERVYSKSTISITRNRLRCFANPQFFLFLFFFFLFFFLCFFVIFPSLALVHAVINIYKLFKSHNIQNKHLFVLWPD